MWRKQAAEVRTARMDGSRPCVWLRLMAVSSGQRSVHMSREGRRTPVGGLGRVGGGAHAVVRGRVGAGRDADIVRKVGGAGRVLGVVFHDKWFCHTCLLYTSDAADE